MTLAHARALLKTDRAHVEDFAPARDDGALNALAVWAIRFTPTVAPDPPDGLLLDITGCARLFRGERRLVQRLMGSVAALGFGARAAVAPTVGGAWAIARYGKAAVSSVVQGSLRAALADLPVGALRLDDDTQEDLYEVGVETVGQLMDLPRSMLPSRFGEGLLLKLDQALGEAIEVIEPVRPVEPASVEMVFDGPTTRYDAISIAARRLLGELCSILASRESGVRRLEVVLGRSDVPPVMFSITLSRPNRSEAHLWSLLRPRIEHANMGFGVDRIGLTASRIGRVRHEQFEAVQGGVAPIVSAQGTGELIDTLVNRLGSQRVVRVELRESHVPERTFVQSAAIDEPTGSARAAALVDADRPSLLFSTPEPAEAIALVPDGPPSVLRWRGQEIPIVRAIGPERIAGEWWRGVGVEGGDGPRDYFKAQDDQGRWLWVFRVAGSARWCVHGLWA